MEEVELGKAALLANYSLVHSSRGRVSDAVHDERPNANGPGLSCDQGAERASQEVSVQSKLLDPLPTMEYEGDAGPLIPPLADCRESKCISRARFLTYFYVSHFLTRWGSRMWEFGVGLFMIAISPESLLLTSAYGLVENLAVASLGVSVGSWVDRTPRLKAVRISLGTRNGSVVAAALALVVLLIDPDFSLGKFKTFPGLVVLVNLFGGLSALAALATNIAVERDWVLAVAEGQHRITLTELNSTMRGIDLTCKLMAPVLVGMIMSWVSVLAAAILLSVWNIISIGFEYYFLRCVYKASPELQQIRAVVNNGGVYMEKTSQIHAAEDEESASSGLLTDVETSEGVVRQGDGGALIAHTSPGFWNRLCSGLGDFHLHLFDGLKVYVRQEMLLAALALAMLYFTVLSFGSLMTAALNWKGIPAYVLGLARGFAALVGISATLAYPKVQGRLQTIRTGLWSITIQWVLLALCVASNWVANQWVSAALLMGGVAFSRFGLWMFDLAVLQLIQESTPENERGIVGGAQNSLQSFLEMLSYVAGMVISNPKDFYKLVYLSHGAVTVAVILYTIQVYRVRGHLLHLDRVFRSR